MKTKCRFYKLTNFTVIDALLKDVPIRCKDAVLPKPLLINHTGNCLTYEKSRTQPYNDNMCHFRALALHLHGNQRLEEKFSKLFNSVINRVDIISPNNFKGDRINAIPIVKDLLTLNILFFDREIVDGNIIGDLLSEVCRNMELLCGATTEIQHL